MFKKSLDNLEKLNSPYILQNINPISRGSLIGNETPFLSVNAVNLTTTNFSSGNFNVDDIDSTNIDTINLTATTATLGTLNLPRLDNVETSIGNIIIDVNTIETDIGNINNSIANLNGIDITHPNLVSTNVSIANIQCGDLYSNLLESNTLNSTLVNTTNLDCINTTIQNLDCVNITTNSISTTFLQTGNLISNVVSTGNLNTINLKTTSLTSGNVIVENTLDTQYLFTNCLETTDNRVGINTWFNPEAALDIRTTEANAFFSSGGSFQVNTNDKDFVIDLGEGTAGNFSLTNKQGTISINTEVSGIDISSLVGGVNISSLTGAVNIVGGAIGGVAISSAIGGFAVTLGAGSISRTILTAGAITDTILGSGTYTINMGTGVYTINSGVGGMLFNTPLGGYTINVGGGGYNCNVLVGTLTNQILLGDVITNVGMGGIIGGGSVRTTVALGDIVFTANLGNVKWNSDGINGFTKISAIGLNGHIDLATQKLNMDANETSISNLCLTDHFRANDISTSNLYVITDSSTGTILANTITTDLLDSINIISDSIESENINSNGLFATTGNITHLTGQTLSSFTNGEIDTIKTNDVKIYSTSSQYFQIGNGTTDAIDVIGQNNLVFYNSMSSRASVWIANNDTMVARDIDPATDNFYELGNIIKFWKGIRVTNITTSNILASNINLITADSTGSLYSNKIIGSSVGSTYISSSNIRSHTGLFDYITTDSIGSTYLFSSHISASNLKVDNISVGNLSMAGSLSIDNIVNQTLGSIYATITDIQNITLNSQDLFANTFGCINAGITNLSANEIACDTLTAEDLFSNTFGCLNAGITNLSANNIDCDHFTADGMNLMSAGTLKFYDTDNITNLQLSYYAGTLLTNGRIVSAGLNCETATDVRLWNATNTEFTNLIMSGDDLVINTPGKVQVKVNNYTDIALTLGYTNHPGVLGGGLSRGGGLEFLSPDFYGNSYTAAIIRSGNYSGDGSVGGILEFMVESNDNASSLETAMMIKGNSVGIGGITAPSQILDVNGRTTTIGLNTTGGADIKLYNASNSTYSNLSMSSNDLIINAPGSIKLIPGSLTHLTNTIPVSDNTHTFGNDSYRWANIRATNVKANEYEWSVFTQTVASGADGEVSASDLNIPNSCSFILTLKTNYTSYFVTGLCYYGNGKIYHSTSVSLGFTTFQAGVSNSNNVRVNNNAGFSINYEWKVMVIAK